MRYFTFPFQDGIFGCVYVSTDEKLAAEEYYVTDPTLYAEANKFDAAKIVEMAKAYPNKCKDAK